jgi:hypothetical protein
MTSIVSGRRPIMPLANPPAWDTVKNKADALGG